MVPPPRPLIHPQPIGRRPNHLRHVPPPPPVLAARRADVSANKGAAEADDFEMEPWTTEGTRAVIRAAMAHLDAHKGDVHAALAAAKAATRGHTDAPRANLHPAEATPPIIPRNTRGTHRGIAPAHPHPASAVGSLRANKAHDNISFADSAESAAGQFAHGVYRLLQDLNAVETAQAADVLRKAQRESMAPAISDGALGTGTARVGAGPGGKSGSKVAGPEQKRFPSASGDDRNPKIQGNPQRTSGPNGDAHAAASLQGAEELAKNPKVKTVHLNKSLRTVTGDKSAPNTRPDVSAIEETGADGLKAVHMVEVQSPSQRIRLLQEKMKSIGKKLPPGYKPGTVKVMPYEKAPSPKLDTDPEVAPEFDPLIDPEIDPLIDPLIEPLIIP